MHDRRAEFCDAWCLRGCLRPAKFAMRGIHKGLANYLLHSAITPKYHANALIVVLNGFLCPFYTPSIQMLDENDSWMIDCVKW